MLKRPINKWPQNAPSASPAVKTETKPETKLETKAEIKAAPKTWVLPRPIDAQPATEAAAKAEVKPDAEIKHYTFEALPNQWLGKGGVADFLDYRDMAAWTITGRRAYSLFQPELMSARLVQHGIRGEQAQVKAMLDRAKQGPWKDLLPKLLREQVVVMDFSYRCFQETPLTLAQAVYFNKDWHLMDMLLGSRLTLLALEVEAEEKIDEQTAKCRTPLFIKQVIKTENDSFDYIAIDKEDLLTESLRKEARKSKTPILIRTGKAPFVYFVYGYDETRPGGHEAHKWLVTPLRLAKTEAESKLLASLPFVVDELHDCGAHLTPALRELVKQGHPLLEQYLTEEELAKQLLALRDNPVRYELPLLTLPENFNFGHATWQEVFRSLSIQQTKPLLIRHGKELHFLCYDYDTETWQMKSVDEPELFNLPFPSAFPLQRCGVFVRQSKEELARRLPPPEVHLAFVLIQPHLDKKPTALYIVNQTGSKPVWDRSLFSIDQNMSTFLYALYPEVVNEAYPELPQLNELQLAKAIQITGLGVRVIAGSELSEEQFAKLASYHTQGTEHGLHCDDRLLPEALRLYIKHWGFWNNEQAKEYWCVAVRTAQTQVAVPKVHQYCNDIRTFNTVPDYATEMSLPRKLEFLSDVNKAWEPWFPLRLGHGLQILQAIVRAGIAESGYGVKEADPLQVRQDLAAIRRLDEVGSEYLVKLKQRLPTPTLAPGLRYP